MSISSVTNTGMQDRIISDLKSAGLSDSLAKTAQAEMQAALQSAGSSGGLDPSKVQDAVSKQLSNDVKSGKITQDQSDQITKAFGELSQKFGAGAGAGGGLQTNQDASGSSSAKTALDQLLDSIQYGSSSSATKHHHHSSAGQSSQTSQSTADYLTQLVQNGLVKTTA